MIRVGFIQPSSDYLFDPFRGDPHTHFHILTILENHFGSDIEALLIDLRGIKKEFAIYHIPECDIYLHSVYTLDYEEQKEIINLLREKYPKAIHIAGGPHVVSFQEECSRLFESIIIGEGEQSIISAIKDFQANKLHKKYVQTNGIDLNSYPFPKRHFLPKSSTARKRMMTLKNKSDFDQLLGTSALFSRGCPYRCHFCALQFSRETNPGIRYRRPEGVAAEIEYLKKDFGVQGLNLHDEIGIPLRTDQAFRHLEAIGTTNIFWRGQCRVDGITPELAVSARQSGCVALGMGVESVVQQCLDIINKKITVERAMEAIAAVKNAGIEARLYIIIGLPGEPPDIVERTWKFIQEAQPDLVYLSLFTVRPGTEVFAHPDNFGIEEILGNWKNTMHMHSRFSDEEIPTLTFRYKEQTQWGPSIPSEQIVKNYLDLQNRLKSSNLCSL